MVKKMLHDTLNENFDYEPIVCGNLLVQYFRLFQLFVCSFYLVCMSGFVKFFRLKKCLHIHILTSRTFINIEHVLHSLFKHFEPNGVQNVDIGPVKWSKRHPYCYLIHSLNVCNNEKMHSFEFRCHVSATIISDRINNHCMSGIYDWKKWFQKIIRHLFFFKLCESTLTLSPHVFNVEIFKTMGASIFEYLYDWLLNIHEYCII